MKIETSREDTRLKLNTFVPAKKFWVNGVREPCISTGVKVRFAGEGEWWNEYQAENGELYYGK